MWDQKIVIELNQQFRLTKYAIRSMTLCRCYCLDMKTRLARRITVLTLKDMCSCAHVNFIIEKERVGCFGLLKLKNECTKCSDHWFYSHEENRGYAFHCEFML